MKNTIKKFFGGAVVAAAFAIGSVALAPVVAADHHTKDKTDIVQTAINAGEFKTLTKALEAAGLVDTLKGKGPFTVFAPTDEAFAKLPSGTLDSLLADKERLKKVLLYHVVPGEEGSRQVARLKSVKTVEGATAKIEVNQDKVMINNANITKADIKASNGVIHVIDTVLLPGE